MAESPVGGFGATLREARERRGMSLRQIASATRISISALEALERNDISKLPGGIFSRAFVRGYATEVGLDPEQTVHDFIEQFPQDSVTAGHPASRPIDDNLEIESDRRTASVFLWMVVVSVPLAGAVLYFSVGRESVEPAPPVARVESIDAPKPSVQEPAAPQPVAAPSSPTNTPMPAVSPPPAVLTVVLTAKGSCWLSAQADGQRVVQRQLEAGDRQTIQAVGEIVFTAGDPSALTATINGGAAKPLGSVGKAVTVRLTPANFKEYLLTP